MTRLSSLVGAFQFWGVAAYSVFEERKLNDFLVFGPLVGRNIWKRDIGWSQLRTSGNCDGHFHGSARRSASRLSVRTCVCYLFMELFNPFTWFSSGTWRRLLRRGFISLWCTKKVCYLQWPRLNETRLSHYSKNISPHTTSSVFPLGLQLWVGGRRQTPIVGAFAKIKIGGKLTFKDTRQLNAVKEFFNQIYARKI